MKVMQELPNNSQRRVVFLLSSFRAGGGEKQMVELANAFSKRGYAVDLLVLKPVGPLREAVDAGVQVRSLDRGRMALSLFPLIAYLHCHKPQAILSLDEYTHTLALLAKPAARSKVRVVLRIGNMLSQLIERYEGKARILPFFLRHLFRRADCIIANSHGVADDIVTVTGITPERVAVVYNPKPREEILRLARTGTAHPWLQDKSFPVIVAAGRLRVQKNFPLLIRVFSRLVAQMPARLLIVGDGRERPHLEALVRELHVSDSVSFAGFQENPYPFLHGADIFVACSLWEGLPNTVLEALVCGAPIIASDCSSGPREILAPDTDYHKRLVPGDAPEYAQFGVLTPVNDEDALLSALQRLLKDSQMRSSYAHRSAERSKDFDAPQALDAYERILFP